MPGEHAVCHAGNALRPSAVLLRLFNIPLSRPRPSPNPHRSAAAYSTPARYPGNRGRRARINDTSSLAVALEAHRRVNRDSIIHKTAAGVVADSSVWFRPELPLDRFDPIVDPESEPASSHSVRSVDRPSGKFRKHLSGKESEYPWSSVRRVSVYRVGAKDRGVPPADYVGEYVKPLYDRQDVLEEDLPWSAASRLANGTALERLRAEMEAFCDYLKPTPDEQAGRAAVLEQTRAVWYRSSKEVQLEVFGSERSGLALATSDIDLRVYNPVVTEESDAKQAPKYHRRQQFQASLTKAFPFYEDDGSFMLIFLRHSRYPLMSMQHAVSGLDVQLVCSNDTSHARTVMARYLEDMPALRTVYTLVKYMLEIRGLTDVFRGGMGSYSIFYMIVAGIKFGPQTAKDDPVAQLLAFMDFYSNFDTTKNWISLEPLEILPKIETKPTQSLDEKEQLKNRKRIGLQSQRQPYLLCICDPADPTNDLGRKTFGWKHLQTTIKVLNERLRQRIKDDDGALLLTPMVGRGFDLFEARREKLATFGRTYSSPSEDQETLAETHQEAASEAAKS